MFCFDVALSTSQTSSLIDSYNWTVENAGCVGDVENNVFFKRLAKVFDFNGDGRAEAHANRHLMRSRQGTHEYSEIAEILDLHAKKVLFRFLHPLEYVREMPDVTGDGQGDFIAATGSAVRCVDARYHVNFTAPVGNQTMGSNRFAVSWDTNSMYGKFELRVAGVSHGYTNATQALVSLGAGTFDLEIYMYDASGAVIAMDTIVVHVPVDITLWIVGPVILGGLATLYTLLTRRSRRAWDYARHVKEVHASD